ncbi:MAG: hypothetical protein ACYDEV_14780 [Acidiferrobacter sp.]
MSAAIRKALRNFDFDDQGHDRGMSEAEITASAAKFKKDLQDPKNNPARWLAEHDPDARARAVVRRTRKARVQEAA